MSVNLLNALTKKQIGTLDRIWNTLKNARNYVQFSSIKELRASGIDRNPHMIVEGRSCFMSNKLVELLHQMVNEISDAPAIKENFIYNTVYHAVFDVLRQVVEGKTIGNFSSVILDKVSKDLEDEYDQREYHFPLKGIKFTDITEFDFGDVRIYDFTEQQLQACLAQAKESGDEVEWMENFLRQCFLNKPVAAVTSYGDRDCAKTKAREKARLTINYLRFLICVLLHSRTHENLIKISFEDERFAGTIQSMYKSSKSKFIGTSSGVGRRNIEDFPMVAARIQELRDQNFYDDISSFAFSSSQTEIEKAVVSAIYWTGEAQNDYDTESAFLKYWTALESVFTTEYTEITENLARGVSSFLVFSHFRFAQLPELKGISREVKRLYKLRSKIAHRGLRNQLNQKDINIMSMYCAQTVLALLDIRNHGFKTMRDIQDNVKRLHQQVEKIESL